MPHKGSLSPLLVWTPRLALAGVFIYAALPKIADPAGFARSIFNYQLAPDRLINLAAMILPWVELLSAVALLAAPALRRGALFLITGLLVIFIAAILSAMIRGLDIECGCFSTAGGGHKASYGQLLLDLALLVAAAWLWRFDRPRSAQ